MTHHSPRLLRVVGMPLICLALFALVGGHWAVLQAIAWAQMLRDYSKNAPIIEAIAKTFSGHSPCGTCTKISEERQKEERAPTASKFDKKAEVFLVEMCDALKRPESEDYSILIRAKAHRSSGPRRLLPRFLYSPDLLRTARDVLRLSRLRALAAGG